ncbi:MAG: hypothetical protein QOG75_6417 [Mycobacterium sp.]|jgi:hypothetical protein|nr:hypothetical protein [Mycobacterium sp.]
MASVMRRFGRGAMRGHYVHVDGPREAFLHLAQAARQPLRSRKQFGHSRYAARPKGYVNDRYRA